MQTQSIFTSEEWEDATSGWGNGFAVQYSIGSTNVKADARVTELFHSYGDILWPEGRHKYNVRLFLGEIDELLRGERFSTFDEKLLDRLIMSLRQRGNSNATINRKLAALRKLLQKAHKMGEIGPLPYIPRLKESAGRIRFLDAEEEDRLFAAIGTRNETAYRLCVFLVDTGCRLGEALGLIWNDLGDRKATFWLTKSGRSRSVPLTERAVAAVSRARQVNGGVKRANGPFSALTQPQFRAIWNEAKAEIGLGKDDQVVPHILRHTCASRLVQGGIDLRRVQMWLGHQTLQMTMRYSHLATSDLDRCVAVLERPAGAKIF